MRHKKISVDINKYCSRYYDYEYYQNKMKTNTNALYLKCLKKCMKIALEKEITGAEKEVIEEYYYKDKKMIEIAKERGVNQSTISREIRLGKAKIREKLEYFEAIYKIVFNELSREE